MKNINISPSHTQLNRWFIDISVLWPWFARSELMLIFALRSLAPTCTCGNKKKSISLDNLSLSCQQEILWSGVISKSLLVHEEDYKTT